MSTQIQNGKNYVIKGDLLNEIGHAFSIDNTYEETLYINNIPNAIKDLQLKPKMKETRLWRTKLKLKMRKIRLCKIKMMP